jgi:hypothetical protein
MSDGDNQAEGAGAHTPDSVTVLHCGRSYRATKIHTWRADPGRWETLAYAAGPRFRFTEYPISGVHDLGAVIDSLRSDPTAFVVRGAISQAARDLITATPGIWIQRKLSGVDTIGSLDDVPRQWLMTDVDNLPCELLEVIDDPEAVVRRAIKTMLPAEFHNATCFWQFSCSTGFKKGTVGIHLWWWLDRAFDTPSIKRWLLDKTKPMQTGSCKIDCSIISGNIPHYIADPIINGGHDPIPRRTGILDGDAEHVTLPPDMRIITVRAPVNANWSGAAELREQYEKLKSALAFIPNDDLDREDWVRIGYAIKAHLGDAGRDLWLAWSRASTKSGKSGATDTAEKAWSGFAPNRISGATIFHRARLAGWEWTGTTVPEKHGLPAFYDAPTEPRETALQRQNDAIRTAIADGGARAVLAREIAAAYEVLREAPGWDALPTDDKTREARTARARILAAAGRTHLPMPPRILVTGAQGTGKTAAAIRAIAALRGDLAVRVLTPTTDKAREFAADYSDAAGPGSLPIRVVRGRAAKDGDTFLCPRARVANAAAAKGINVRRTICPKCPLRPMPLVQPGCGYLRQEAEIDAMNGRGIFVGAHHYLHLAMPGPAPDITIIDESVTLAAAAITEVSPDSLRDPMPFRGSELAEAMATNVTVNATLTALQAPAPLAALRSAGVTAEAISTALTALVAANEEPNAGITGDMPDAHIQKAVDALPDNRIDIVITLLRAVLQEMPHARDTLTGIVFHPRRAVMVDGKTEYLPRLRVHHLREISDITRETTLLLLDGTGNPDLNRAIFGTLKHVHVPVERDAVVIGTSGKTYSRQSITGADRNGKPMQGKATEAARLRRDIAAIARRLPGPALVVATKPAAKMLARGLPDTACVAHFGALRGLNAWEECASALIVGRESVSVEAVEDIARAFIAADAQPFTPCAVPMPPGWRTGWPFTATRGRRMRDGTVQQVEVEVHPDPRAQAVLEQIREAEILQAADRVRPVFNRRRIVLANNLVLDVTYSRAMTHAELVAGGNRLEQAYAATGILPLGAADLHAAHPRLFATEKNADNALCATKLIPPFSKWYLYLEKGGIFRYRRTGQRGRESRAVIATDRHPDPRAALAAALRSELALFVPEQTEPADPAPAPADAPTPEPAHQDVPAPEDVREAARVADAGQPARVPIVAEAPASPPVNLTVLGDAAPWPADIAPVPPPVRPAPPRPLPDVPTPEQRARLANLTRRLTAARPPTLWGDEFDSMREQHWRERIAALAPPQAPPPVRSHAPVNRPVAAEVRPVGSAAHDAAAAGLFAGFHRHARRAA